MTQPPEIDVSELIAGAKLGKLHVAILGLCALMLFFDGFDAATPGIAAPAMIRAFHFEKSAMGIVFSSWFFGVLIGSLAIAFVSDRWGRKVGSITSLALYTLAALATVLVTNVNELIVLRVIGGIGIGGVMPTTLALLAETAPKRYRASFAMIALFGYPVGSTSAGQVAAWFIPHYGWQVVFLAAGTGGLVLGTILFFVLPESMQFLALRKPDSPQLRRLLRRLVPGRAIGPETRLVARHEKQAGIVAMPLLFAGRLKTTTMLIWLVYFADGITYLTFTSWLPVFLESSGLSPTRASFTYSFAASAAIVTSLIIMRPLDRFGPWASAVAAVLAIAAVAGLGTPGLPVAAVIAFAIASHALCGTTHTSLNGTIGAFYPTSLRSNSVGYASALGRVGSIIGPMTVGFLLSAHFPLQGVLYLVAAPEIAVALGCIGLGKIYRASAAASAEPAENAVHARAVASAATGS